MEKKEIKHLKSIDKIYFDRWYQSGLKASVDWIAGGNFDGEIYQNYLRFSTNDDIVEFKSSIIYSRQKLEITENITLGRYQASAKGSINLSFEHFSMHGFVLGESHQYIAFDVHYPSSKVILKSAYELMELDSI